MRVQNVKIISLKKVLPYQTLRLAVGVGRLARFRTFAYMPHPLPSPLTLCPHPLPFAPHPSPFALTLSPQVQHHFFCVYKVRA